MPIIAETPRLILRTHEDRDLDAVARMSADRQMMRFMGGQTQTREEVAQRLAKVRAVQDRSGFVMCAMELKETGEFVGECGLLPVARPGRDPSDYEARGPEIEVGYRLLPEHQGRGYAREGSVAALRYGFTVCGLKRILAVTDPENLPSRSVLLAIGMRCIGQNESYFSPTVMMYEMTAREFAARENGAMT
jgi:RimJ/RimL family protein N-acetyltransferase